jgi:outer membrane protein assembly factor BamB
MMVRAGRGARPGSFIQGGWIMARTAPCARAHVLMLFAALAPPAFAQQLIWDTRPGVEVRFGTTSESVRAVDDEGDAFLDTEVADDFLARGTIERLVMQGTSCCEPQVLGAFARFYQWTADGPGALQAEYFLDASDPNFRFVPGAPTTIELTLADPFEATGWHFVAVQLVTLNHGPWSLLESNPDEPLNSFVWFRDNLTGGDWIQDRTGGAPDNTDMSFALFGTARPVVASVSPRSTTPSGRLVILGSAFGTSGAESQVIIGGERAIITRRRGHELHAYVPENVAPGQMPLRVVGEQGVSNTVALNIEPRTPQGRVQWRFQTDDRTTSQFIARGPDGSVYTSDNLATYALSGDGGLRWVSFAASGDTFGARPIDIGADGTVYTGVDFVGNDYAAVIALNPVDGSVRWRFFPPAVGDLIAGPNVGPDGNIYGVQDTTFGGIGAFALDPQGNLLWSNPGQPRLSFAEIITTSKIVFGSDRLHFGIVRARSGGNPVIYTFLLGGAQRWTSDAFDVHVTTFPEVDPFDRVILGWGQTGLRAIAPAGNEQWFTLHPNGASLVVRPAIASDGTIYSGDFIGVELWALDPAGNTIYARPRGPLDSLSFIDIAPDDSVLVTGGGLADLVNGYVRGHRPADGAILWQVTLPPEDGLPQLVSSFDFVFSADSSTVYATTLFADEFNEYTYLYAIATAPGAAD